MKERNRVIVVDSLGVIRSTPTIVRSLKKDDVCSVVAPCHILLFLRIGCNIKDVMTRSSFGNTTYNTINHQTTVSNI
jgi:hypothetical protein